MADLSNLQAAMPIKIAGANPSTGVDDNFTDVDINGKMNVKDVSIGDILGQILLELRSMRLALTVLATEGQLAKPEDFNPENNNDNIGTSGQIT